MSDLVGRGLSGFAGLLLWAVLIAGVSVAAVTVAMLLPFFVVGLAFNVAGLTFQGKLVETIQRARAKVDGAGF